jgi:hypothetical protein
MPPSHLSGIYLPELAPHQAVGCRGFTGPVPQPLRISGPRSFPGYERDDTTGVQWVARGPVSCNC